MENNSMPARRLKWPVAYIFLGTFNVLSLLGSYYLNAEIVRVQEESVRVNQEWATAREKLADYRRLARDLDDSANNIFVTKNSDDERANADRALADFIGNIRAMREGIAANGTQSNAATLFPKMTLLEASMHKMAVAAEETFRFFDKGNLSQADLRKATTNAERSTLGENVTELGNAIEAIQHANFRDQLDAVWILREFQFLIGSIILLMIGATAAYGIKVAQAARKRVAELETTAKSLCASEAKLANIFKMAPEGILAADEAGCITMFSDGAEAMFGYQAGEIIGRSMDCLMPERYRAAHYKHVRAFTAAPSASRKMGSGVEIVGLHKNGEEFPMEASLSKINMPDGITVTAILRDLTHAKAMYKDLLNAKLQAEEASKAKSNFIANMSHELRTPLNAILGFSELLDSEKFAAQRVEYAKIIHGSGQHLLNLINDILDLSKVEAGQWTLHETTIDFRLLASDCVELMASNAKTAQIALRADICGDLPPVSGDERALKQVLLNLISNAVKYTRAGGDVIVFARLEENGELAFGVKDTGVGIDKDEQDRVFDKFGQGRHETVRADRGTGLGLPIVKGLALAHGGRVTLQSQVDLGTCFTVFLPANRVQQYKAQKVA